MDKNLIQAKEWLGKAKAVLITASNGLSISEGYHIFANNAAFHQYFGAFASRFGLQNIVQGLYYRFPDQESQDAFQQALITYMIDDYAGHAVFTDLKAIIGEKDYFVLTSNVDTHFQLNGFEDAKVFEIEGNILDGIGMSGDKWQSKQAALDHFLTTYQDDGLVVLELGIGSQNRLIKAPIMNWIAQHSQVKFISLNLPQEINIPMEIAARSLALTGPITETFKELVNHD